MNFQIHIFIISKCSHASIYSLQELELKMYNTHALMTMKMKTCHLYENT